MESKKVIWSVGKFDFHTLDFGLLQIFVGEVLLLENKSVVLVEVSDNELALSWSATLKLNGVCSTFAKVNGVLALNHDLLLKGDGVITIAKFRCRSLNGDLIAEFNGVGPIAAGDVISGECSCVDIQFEGAFAFSIEVRLLDPLRLHGNNNSFKFLGDCIEFRFLDRLECTDRCIT